MAGADRRSHNWGGREVGQSACVLCSNGCGLDIGVAGNRIVGVRGRGGDQANRGRLGPKGLHGWEANYSPTGLRCRLSAKRARCKQASWDEAMSLIVEKSKELREKFTASSIGFYASGQLFLEEYYTLALIGKGGLGTPHMDGNTRLCTATAGESLKQTFGSDGRRSSTRDQNRVGRRHIVADEEQAMRLVDIKVGTWLGLVPLASLPRARPFLVYGKAAID